VLWGGNNDLTFNATPSGVASAVGNEATLIGQLATAGARQFLVLNVPPLGDTPTIKALGQATADGLNQLSAGFRQNLPLALGQVQQQFAAAGINLRITIVDSFDLLRRAEANPRAYGLEDVTSIAQNFSFKDTADRFLFWDGFHPTAAGHYQIAVEAYTDLTGIPVVQLGTASNTVGRTAALPTLYLTRSGNNLSSDLEVNFAVTDASRETFTAVIPAGQRTVEVNVPPSTAPRGRARRGRTVRVALLEGNGYVLGRVELRDLTVAGR